MEEKLHVHVTVAGSFFIGLVLVVLCIFKSTLWRNFFLGGSLFRAHSHTMEGQYCVVEGLEMLYTNRVYINPCFLWGSGTFWSLGVIVTVYPMVLRMVDLVLFASAVHVVFLVVALLTAAPLLLYVVAPTEH